MARTVSAPPVRTILAAAVWLSVAGSAEAALPKPVLVTVDNFNQAETDGAMALFVRDGGFGKFIHRREPTSVDQRTTVHPTRDTLVSNAVFDLDAGSVTITLPDAGQRFMSMQVIDEEHYTPAVYYGGGSYTLTRDQIGTRFVIVFVRMLLDVSDAQDVRQVHALQDAIRASQNNFGKFEIPNWNQLSQRRVRAALITLATTVPDTVRMFGARGDVDPVRHLIGTALNWGGTPDKDAMYLNVTPSRNDGVAIYRLEIREVPVDGFWSISVYDAEGYFQRNAYDAYNVNSMTAKRSADDSVSIQFGGCDGRIPNCLPIVSGWNYMVRLYRPRREIRSGAWRLPPAQPVG